MTNSTLSTNSLIQSLEKSLSFNVEHYSITLAICIIGAIACRILNKHLKNTVNKNSSGNITFGLILSNFGYFSFWFFALLITLDFMGISLTPIITILGASVLAIGLGLKDSLNNVANGLIITFLQPFKIGDLIKEGSSAEPSKVKSINLFYSKLTNNNGETLLVPNSKIWGNALGNLSESQEVCIELIVPVTLKGDISAACTSLEKILGSQTNILEKPAPAVALWNLRENDADIIVRVWVKSNNYSLVRLQLPSIVKTELEKSKVYNTQ